MRKAFPSSHCAVQQAQQGHVGAGCPPASLGEIQTLQIIALLLLILLFSALLP